MLGKFCSFKFYFLLLSPKLTLELKLQLWKPPGTKPRARFCQPSWMDSKTNWCEVHGIVDVSWLEGARNTNINTINQMKANKFSFFRHWHYGNYSSQTPRAWRHHPEFILCKNWQHLNIVQYYFCAYLTEENLWNSPPHISTFKRRKNLAVMGSALCYLTDLLSSKVTKWDQKALRPFWSSFSSFDLYNTGFSIRLLIEKLQTCVISRLLYPQVF